LYVQNIYVYLNIDYYLKLFFRLWNRNYNNSCEWSEKRTIQIPV